ncbi:MAG: UDP-N-acetylmuramoyl-L-alanine--D-glutamate ligase [Sedimentisphaerales bacterium]|nr:UDP-N-acetylmuramoyl-L-alanine--D-glutamate ligase [Sedimentisphaerales bacterium]
MQRPSWQGQWGPSSAQLELKGKTVLVLGLGRFGGGVDAALFLARSGSRVIVSDAARPETLQQSLAQLAGLENIDLRIGQHRPADVEEADLLLVNPAVPDESPYLATARALGRPITTAVNLFFQHCPARIIGVTGSNGKSTTAALIAFLLEKARPQDATYGMVWLSGNIGNIPLLGLLDQIRPEDLVVLELSSFQIPYLELIGKGPKVAVLTNLTPNHLDRHKTFEAYCLAKEPLFALQPLDPKDPALSVFNQEDPVGMEWYRRYSGQPGRFCRTFSPDQLSAELTHALPLPGRINQANLAAAMVVAGHFSVTDQAAAMVLPAFKGLPHRLELVATIDGVRYYNDSIATTPESAIAALEAFEQPKIIIAGGSDKGLSYQAFGQVVAKRAKVAVLVGATAQRIAEAIMACPDNQAKIIFVKTFEQAVYLASQNAQPGDVVLLSPASASFDMFDNFQQRGLEFARLVRQLATKTS